MKDFKNSEYHLVCFTIAYLCFCNLLISQNPDYKISELANATNITHNTVSSVYKDSLGFLWFGKTDGLTKYNGYDFEIFNSTIDGKTGLSNPWVADIKDFGNYLVIGTKNGLNFLNKKTQYFNYFFPSDYNSDYSNNITCININNPTSVLIGTENELLRILPKKDSSFAVQKIQFNEFDNELHNVEVLQLLTVPNGILIRTSIGIFFLKEESHRATRMIFKSDTDGHRIHCNVIYLTPSKNLLIAGDNEPYYINLEQNLLVDAQEHITKPLTLLYPNWPQIKKINVFLKDINGNLLVGTEGEGLFVYLSRSQNWRSYRHKMNNIGVLNNDFIRTLYQDDSGMVVVGTDSGINILTSQENKFQVINSVKKNNQIAEILNVHTILKDYDKNLWIGTRGKGIFIIGHDENTQINIKHSKNNSLDHIRSIIQDKQKHIWIGTQKGIYIIKEFHHDLENIRKQFLSRQPDILPNEYIYAILEDEDSNKWISTANGLFIYTANKRLLKLTGIPTSAHLENKTIYTMHLDDLGRIWLGTLNGLICYINPEDYRNRNLSNPNYLKNINFQSIHILPKYKKFFKNYETYSITATVHNDIFVGTNFGLCKIDVEQKELSPFFDPSNKSKIGAIEFNYVYGLLYNSVNNTLWASSNKGLFSYDLENNKVIRFTLKDGLQSLEFNGNSVFKSDDGKLYFGGANGVNVLDSNHKLEKSSYGPNLVLTKLEINGKEINDQTDSRVLKSNISYSKGIVLKAGENTIGLEFASLHLPFSAYNSYKCRLIGIDNDWISLGHKRSINYANLPKGKYLFQVMGTNNDGAWNTQELLFGIEILPAWYETWWMTLSWYLLAILIITLFIWMLLKNRDNINALKIQEIERKNLYEIYESKLVFFTNLSHELRTPLSLILDPIQSLIQQKRIYNSNRDMLDIVKNNVDRLRRLIDQIMDFRKFEYGKLSLKVSQGEIVSSVSSISSSFLHYSKIKDIHYIVQLPQRPIPMFFDRDSIEKIVYNLLSNAFKATSKGGMVRISMEEVDFSKKLSKWRKYHLVCGEKDFKNLVNHIYIKVTDTGVGITKENLSEIFARFYQGDSADSGTGIGLYMVKQLTEMHYGTILIKSKKNKGTSFIIILPKNDDLYKTPQVNLTTTTLTEKQQEQTSPITEEDLTVGKSKKYNVVIVEDNDELRIYLKLILMNYYNVYTASNGLEGIELIQDETPDVVISDIVMPQINGLELCKRLKENFATSHIPIILLTAKAFDDQIVEGIQSGADAYITKPFNKAILIAKINNLIQNREKLHLIFQNSKILEPSKIGATSLDEKLLYKLKQTIEENIEDQNLSLELLASEVGVSRAQLFRKMKALTGLTPNNFIKSIRLKYAAQLLENQKFNISEVAFLTGFREASYFSRCFKETYGCSPKEYNKS